MITNSIRRAYRFFHANAGYCTPPGRAQCALDLARAEEEGKRAGLEFGWDSCDSAPGAEVCICYSAQGQFVCSLGGIEGADRNYRRVIQAELAQEALAELAKYGHLYF